jgi:hypothetical protein
MKRFLPLAGSLLLLAPLALCLSLDAQERPARPYGAALKTIERRADDKNDVRLEPPIMATIRELNSKTNLRVEHMPLEKFAQFLSEQHKIPVKLDRASLSRANINPRTLITANYVQFPLDVALRRILAGLKLRHHVVDGVVIITAGLPSDPAERIGDRPVRNGRLAPGQAVNIAPGQAALNQAAWRQQMLQQLHPLVQIELLFVKRICAPTKDQMRQLKEDLEKYIKDQSDEFIQIQQGRDGRAGSLVSKARALLQEHLTAAVEQRLSRESAARYRSELEKRDANERAVCARSLVAILDRELCLSARQREALRAALTAKWDDAWTQLVEMGVMQGQSYIPSIPDDLIEPQLETAQTEVWQNMQKLGNINWGFQVFQNGMLGMPLPDPEDD